jgi:hypothetical protein
MRPPTATDLYTPATDAEAVFHPAALLHLFESSTPSYPLWHDIDRFHASAAARRALGSTSMADDGRGFNASYLDGSARSLR